MISGCPTDVRLRAVWVEGVGYRYDVLLDGDVIVRRSRDPEHDAARVLHARGLRGRFRTIDFRTGRPRMVLDIDGAAHLRVIERDAGGPPILDLYRAMSDEDRGRARMHRSDEGRRSAPGTVRRAPIAGKRNGGESGVGGRPQSSPGAPGPRVGIAHHRWED